VQSKPKHQIHRYVIVKFTTIIQPCKNNLRTTCNLNKQHHFNSLTRMVQLPATAAIEYVAACWVSGAGEIFVRGCFCPGNFFPGGLLPGGIFGQGDFWPGGFLSGVLLSGWSFARGDFFPGGLFPRGHFWPGRVLSVGAFVQGDFCPGGLCLFHLGSMRIRTV